MNVLNLFLRGSATLGLAAVLTATASAADLPVKVISGFVSPESDASVFGVASRVQRFE